MLDTHRAGAVTRLLAAVSLFSLNPIIFRQLPLEPVAILAAVCAIAGAVLAATGLRTGGITALVPAGAARGPAARLVVWFVLNNILYVTALKTTTIANATLTHYLAPLMVAALAAPLLGERVRPRVLAAIGLACAGTAVMMAGSGLSLGDRHFVGVLAGTASAVFFALEIVEKKRLAPIEPADRIAVRYLLFGATLLAPFVDYAAFAALTVTEGALLLLSGIVVTAAGNLLFNSALRTASAQHAAVAGYVEPAGAIAWALVLLGEVPDAFGAGGAALVAAGIALSLRAQVPPADAAIAAPHRSMSS